MAVGIPGSGQTTLAWTAWHTIVVLGSVVAVALIGVLTPSSSRLWAWIGIMALLGIFAIVAGHGITGYWRGLLIDEQNSMSLSRLQLATWTILILSAFLAAALDNVHTGQKNPLAIAIPAEVWALLGISTTSLVGTPLILNTKKLQPLRLPGAGAAQAGSTTSDVLKSQGFDPAKISAAGPVVVNNTAMEARWSDVFTGDEVGNGAHLDLSKVQMFYFTVVIVLAYGVTLGNLFRSTGAITHFPVIDQAMVALLGISHAGYLTNKAIPHPPSIVPGQ